MAKEYLRTDRVAPLIQTTLARLIPEELFAPWVSKVTLTDVEVTRDYSLAKIFVSVLSDDDSEIAMIIHGLNAEKKALRFQLSKKINLRTTPNLHFYFDRSVREGRHLSDILNKLSDHGQT